MMIYKAINYSININCQQSINNRTNSIPHMSDNPLPPAQPYILSKPFSSTRSCQNLFCLTKRCQQQSKQKQKILNSQYFEKLSLKQFTNPSLMFNQSFHDKSKGMRRDKSTEDSEFRNVVINPYGIQQPMRFSIGGNTQQHNDNTQRSINKVSSSPCYNQTSNQATQRIIRSSSYRQLGYTPQLKSNNTVEKQLEKDYRKISELSNLRNRLEQEIHQLDVNIDQYYGVYHSKLNQLKNIQSRIHAVEKVEQKERVLVKMPSKDQLNGNFRKKVYPAALQLGQNIAPTQHIAQNNSIMRYQANGVDNIVSKTKARTYFQNSNLSIVKKTN